MKKEIVVKFEVERFGKRRWLYETCYGNDKHGEAVEFSYKMTIHQKHPKFEEEDIGLESGDEEEGEGIICPKCGNVYADDGYGEDLSDNAKSTIRKEFIRQRIRDRLKRKK